MLSVSGAQEAASRATEQRQDAALRAAETQTLARETRNSDDFIKAIDQLGNATSLSMRVGGILGLGRLLRTATEDGDYWPIMDVIASFVRGSFPVTPNSPRATIPPEDLQNACNILARRSGIKIYPRSYDSPVDLNGADLSKTWLSGAHFEEAYLEDANLAGADLSGAFLQGANFTDAELKGTNLSGANLVITQMINFRYCNF